MTYCDFHLILSWGRGHALARHLLLLGTQVARDIAALIPTLGRDSLRRCIRCIASGSVQPAEIVISHQGAVGSLDAMLKEFVQLGVKVRYLRSDQRGAAAARNAGIRVMTTRFFVATDDDCFADPAWLEEMAQTLRQNPEAIVTGRVLASATGAPSVVKSAIPRVYKSMPLRGDHFSGGNFGAAVEAFRAVGDFDESELVRYCEDPEWSYRALRAGRAIHYVPTAVVTHMHWRSDQALAELYSHYAFSQGGWYGRELRRFEWSFLVHLTYDLTRGARRWLQGLMEGNRTRRAQGRAFVIDLLRGVAVGWHQEKAATD